MGASSNVSAGAYNNSITPTDRPQGPAAPATTGSNWLGYGATSVGGVAKAYAQHKAGRANQRLARINAKAARMQADQAIQAGEFTANRIDAKERQIAGSEAAAQAAGGTVVGAGTSGLVRAAGHAAALADEQQIRLNARREAYGFKSRASIDEFQGRLAKREGNLAATETLMNTGTKLWQEADAVHRLEF